ncbi:MAG: DDE-type integrase/transposase/recombinase [Lachnospiraceae bacterium]|nr:DDE-type integrase/transposase/recombinase [Lachnospiraceae bacterium]
MASITQDMRFRLSLIKYANQYGVTKAAIKYKTNRQYIDRWKRRFDGSIESLRDLSRRPHHHPNQHTDPERKLILDMRRRNPDAGLVVFWVKLLQHGYSRSITGLYRFLKKQNLMAVHPRNPKYVPKPYESMDHPGQRIQVDVKFVPSACLTNSRVIGKPFFQYTAIDEYSRWRYVEAFEEHSTYSSAMFVDHLVKAFPCRIECIQTDNGSEFTNRFTTHRDRPTLFQMHLEQHGIRHKLIRPFTPRHNGKVERSHRKDNERFYATHRFYSFEDFAKQLKRYNDRDYNNFPMRPLGWKSPAQVLKDYLQSV